MSTLCQHTAHMICMQLSSCSRKRVLAEMCFPLYGPGNPGGKHTPYVRLQEVCCVFLDEIMWNVKGCASKFIQIPKYPPLLQLDILKGIVPQAQVVLNLISHGGPSSLWRENIRGRDVHHTPASDPNETNCRDDLEQQVHLDTFTSCREPWAETLMFFYVIPMHPGKCRNFM